MTIDQGYSIEVRYIVRTNLIQMDHRIRWDLQTGNFQSRTSHQLQRKEMNNFLRQVKRIKLRYYIFKMRNLKRVLALSDTHGNLRQFELIRRNNIQGDLFIHSGDFSKYSKQQGLQQFFHELELLKFRHKIVIAGNHEVALDRSLSKEQRKVFQQKFSCKMNRETIIEKLKERCVYLQHEGIQIEGVKIFGTPYCQSFIGRGAFQYTSQNQEAIFTSIPQNIEILITHHPPFQILDKALSGHQVGSKVLLEHVKKIRPKLHVFGHVHESNGIVTIGGTTYVNAATEYKQIDLSEIY